MVRGKNDVAQRSDRTRTSATTRWKAATLNLSKMQELASETVEKKYFRPVECAYLDTVHLTYSQSTQKLMQNAPNPVTKPSVADFNELNCLDRYSNLLESLRPRVAKPTVRTLQ